jgi:2-dehydro-3-deoxy-D-arabinonate dehydratase
MRDDTMKLTRHQTTSGPAWAVDNNWLAEPFTLCRFLEMPLTEIREFFKGLSPTEPAEGALLAPIEANQEVWASGVTYLRSREARQAESDMGDVYDRVYAAERPELFFKTNGWRVMGPQQPLRFRADSKWNVPEPELTLVINQHGEIIGFTGGNDMSSRSIEGENPLYLPQAKIYNAACSLGPAIQLMDVDGMRDLQIEITIKRAGQAVFHGSTSTANMNRNLEELATYLFRELSFPQGVFLMTGTGIVPPDAFTLTHSDLISIRVGDLILENEVGL